MSTAACSGSLGRPSAAGVIHSRNAALAATAFDGVDPLPRIGRRADRPPCRQWPLSRRADDVVMTWCETHGGDYVFGLATNARLIVLFEDELAAAVSTFAATQGPARVFAARTYQTLDSWSCARRVVAKAEQLAAPSDGGPIGPPIAPHPSVLVWSAIARNARPNPIEIPIPRASDAQRTVARKRRCSLHIGAQTCS